MTDLERRNRLADHETSVEGHGECFIAIHMDDGSVHTISGIADTVTIKPDCDNFLSWSGRFEAYGNGWDVTVHFTSDLVQEVKSMDGEVVDA